MIAAPADCCQMLCAFLPVPCLLNGGLGCWLLNLHCVLFVDLDVSLVATRCQKRVIN